MIRRFIPLLAAVVALPIVASAMGFCDSRKEYDAFYGAMRPYGKSVGGAAPTKTSSAS